MKNKLYLVRFTILGCDGLFGFKKHMYVATRTMEDLQKWMDQNPSYNITKIRTISDKIYKVSIVPKCFREKLFGWIETKRFTYKDDADAYKYILTKRGFLVHITDSLSGIHYL